MSLHGLYIVACPIGNYADITLRALAVLREIDVIAAEDTRETGKLLAHHGIEAGRRLVSCHEHNERQRLEALIARLLQGESVALVSDAGTPGVSDPGFPLVARAIENHIPIVPVPGVSAATAALTASGLPTDAYFFEGFLPKKKARRLKRLAALKDLTASLVFFESPRRITATLEELIDSLGDRPAAVCREMTKPYEEFLRGRLSEIRHILEQRQTIKGEITLVVAGSSAEQGDVDADEIRRLVEKGDNSPSQLAAELAARYGLPKRRLYQKILRIKNEANNGC